jgi:hypothetical protein
VRPVVLGEKIGPVEALSAVAAPPAIRLRSLVERPSAIRRLHPAGPREFDGTCLASLDRDGELEIGICVKVRIGGELLRECDRIEPVRLRNARQIATKRPAVKFEAEGLEDLAEVRRAQSTVGIQRQRMREGLVGRPAQEGFAMLAKLVSLHPTIVCYIAYT